MSAKARRRMYTKEPRTAYCTGCGVVFDKMHLLFNHRGTERCGGRFLPADERACYDKAKLYQHAMEAAEREGNEDLYRLNWFNSRDQLTRAYGMRKIRLEAVECVDVAA